MIVFFNPRSSAARKPVLPLSLLSLAACLEGTEEYCFVDGNLEKDPATTLHRLIRENRADLLAVTVMPGPQLAQAVPLCRELKSRYPYLKIVWGGYFPTQHFDVCLTGGPADYVIRGHGEDAFKKLAASPPGQESIEGIPGLSYFDTDSGELVDNGLSPVPDPEALSDFPYHRLPVERYVRRTFMGRTLSHHSSYGCPFVCNFCAVVNMVKGRWKAQSAKRTADVIRFLVSRWNLDAVEFFDNNFFVDQARVAEFSERISDLQIGWWGEARIDTLLMFSDQTWSSMAGSGLKMVFLGAESGSRSTLQRMSKGGTASPEKTLEIAEKAARFGIVPEFSFVLGAPPEPEAEIEETLEFIRKVKKVNPACEIILYLYTPVPLAGELHEEALQAGLKWPKTLDEWLLPFWQEFVLRRSEGLPWIDRNVRQRIGNFERVLNAYYPTTTDVRLTRSRRLLLRLLSGWRYHLRIYELPLELKVLQRLTSYQRPETAGF